MLHISAAPTGARIWGHYQEHGNILRVYRTNSYASLRSLQTWQADADNQSQMPPATRDFLGEHTLRIWRQKPQGRWTPRSVQTPSPPEKEAIEMQGTYFGTIMTRHMPQTVSLCIGTHEPHPQGCIPSAPYSDAVSKAALQVCHLWSQGELSAGSGWIFGRTGY